MNGPWTIILAAGAGRRLASLTGGVPKQYWRGPSGRSLLDETLQRFSPISDRAHTVVIADATHRPYLPGAGNRCDTVIYQPRDRGTAAGVVLALSPVLATEPDATVVITPADHGVKHVDAYLQGIRAAVATVHATDEIIVFGVEPTSARDDYGWILSAPGSRSHFRPIALFVEKPEKRIAERLLQINAAWNTMVIVARARKLRDLCFEFLPGLKEALGAVLAARAGFGRSAVEDAYAALPLHDFSRDVLSHARTLSTYTWPAAIGWADLGTPDRMLEWHKEGRNAHANPTLTRHPSRRTA